MRNALILAIVMQIAIFLFIIFGIVKRKKQHIEWKRTRKKVYFVICLLSQAVIGVFAIVSAYNDGEWLLICIISAITSINVYTQLSTTENG